MVQRATNVVDGKYIIRGKSLEDECRTLIRKEDLGQSSSLPRVGKSLRCVEVSIVISMETKAEVYWGPKCL